MSTGANAERSEAGAARSRSRSYRPRSGPITSANSAHTMPSVSAAACHPSPSTMTGTAAPAIAVPRGTPVCLIEKVSASIPAGAVRARITELAGVAGP